MRSTSRSTQSLLSRDSRMLSRQPSYGVAELDDGPQRVRPPSTHARIYLVRAFALVCACSLSLGAHYGSYILGPLKTRLTREMGTSNTEFSLILAAFSLNSTWTPLVGGVLAGRLGTTLTSIIATGLIFVGLLTLLFGDSIESVRVMTLGMFIFGLGTSPLAVVQESIIVRFFKDHGLGMSMAFGLVFGKASSFISARTSYPLSEAFGPRAPFFAATFVAAFSFCMNLVYVSASRWLVKSTGAELEASELRQEAMHRRTESVSEAQALKQVARKRTVHLRDISKLGDVFWAYIGLNILFGAIWSPFSHLASNIFEKRYELTELKASTYASYLLAGSVFLYPIIGCIIDRFKGRAPIVLQLFALSATLTTLSYLWLVLPPSFTGTPIPSIALFGIGQGYAPLLLVLIVPTIVSTKYIPTTLGAHKALEHCGTTIYQTFAGLLLDRYKKDNQTPGETSPGQLRAIQQLLNVFFLISICYFLSLIGLWSLDRRRKAQYAAIQHKLREHGLEDEVDCEPEIEPELLNGHGSSRISRKERASESHSLRAPSSMSSPVNQFRPPLPPMTPSETVVVDEEDEGRESEGDPLLQDDAERSSTAVEALAELEQPIAGEAQSRAEHVRGTIFGVCCIFVIAFAWIFFITTAFLKLRARNGGSKQE